MNKNQKTLLMLLLTLGSMIGGFSHGALNTTGRENRTFPVNKIEAVSCDNEKKIYLDQDIDEDGLQDKSFFMNNNISITTTPAAGGYSAASIYRSSTNGTRVLYFSPYSDMVYKLNSLGYPSTLDGSTFWRGSYVFPYQQAVRGIATNPNKIVVEKPYDNNTGKNTIGFVFRYAFFVATNFHSDGTPQSSYQYHSIPDMSYFFDSLATLTNIIPNTKRVWDPNLYTYTGCTNFKLYRCGDGKVSPYLTGQRTIPFTGELCDDGALNGTPGHCALGCGNAAQAFSCGDSIINDGSVTTVTTSGDFTYGPTYMSGGIEQIEQCDEGANNNDNYQVAGCSTFCEDNLEPESFPEELGG